MSDLWSLADGSVLSTHSFEACLPPCPLHAPSDHHMVGWELVWSTRERTLARVCSHGELHFDPDALPTRRSVWGCATVYCSCGCCVPPPGNEGGVLARAS